MLRSLFSGVYPFVPAVGVVVVFVLAGHLARRLLDRQAESGRGASFRVQVIQLGLILVGVLAFLVALPLKDQLRGQLISLFGILLSAAVALSSTTFLGNVMAGLMLKATRNFRTGDFVRVSDHFGRVSARSLLFTEIQTEERDLVTLPNLFLVTHPLTVVRASGTIVHTSVSLGYDVPRKRIKALLLEAAAACELEDPFVQVRELGDFSVSYRVAGLLGDVKQLLTKRSELRGRVMDALHGGGIEIVSPNFMNQRVLPEGRRFVPRTEAPSAGSDASPLAGSEPSAESVIFDKAELAGSLEELRDRLADLESEEKETRKAADEAANDGEKQRLTERADRLRAGQERLAEHIARREDELAHEDEDRAPGH
jgi:small-conductance mechanosensitive channel